MKSTAIAVLFASPLMGCSVASAQTLSPESFANPPLEARPAGYWPWLNGSADMKTITSDLEQAKAKGMSGLEIWDVAAHSDPNKIIPVGAAFLGPESVKLIRHALSEGKRLGLNIGMVASSGWNAGGTWVRPDWAQKHLYSSSHEVTGPADIAIELPFPEVPAECPKNADGLPQFFREVAVLAVPANATKEIPGIAAVVDLSKNFKDGKLTWSAPDGKWEILRFICSNNGQYLIVPSPNSVGLHIDFLEPAATRRHFQYILGQLGITKENAADVGLKWLEFDSMELGEGNPWTDRFSEYFHKWCGYDPIPYLPILAGWKITGVTDMFLYDLRKALSEQMIFSHYAGGRDYLKSYGIQLIAEAGGPGPPVGDTCSVDAIKALGSVSVPRGEFWNRHRNIFLIKQISSAAHGYGQKFTSAESFTTWRRWMDGPFSLKQLADRALCEGVNQFVFHTFAHSPLDDGLPGRAYHAGSDLNPRATWWDQSKPFIDYLSRSCYMLQQGKFVADVCGFYGDQAPNFWPLFHDVPNKPVWPGLAAGYDYDVTDSDVIVNRMRVVDGRIVLPDGMSYALLALPAQDHIPAEVLEKIASLVKDGATVVGPEPARDPRLLDQASRTSRVRALADELWGNDPAATAKGRAVGKGKVFAGVTPTEVLKSLAVPPDFTCEKNAGGPEVDFIHRRTADADLYFVRNTSSNSGVARCHFRAHGRQAELWDPATGLDGFRVACAEDAGGTTVDLPLASHASTFVVFRDGPAATPAPMFAQVDAADRVDGPWSVRFTPGWGAPDQTGFPSLKSWTDSADEGIKYYSGTAVYQKTLDLPAAKLADGRRIMLDLGDVREVAEVALNGKPLGIVWKPPFRVDLTPAARAGENQLTVKVTNLWVNRLRGDMLTKGKHYTRTNQKPYTESIGGDEPWRELPSGLLGPVRLLYLPRNGQVWSGGDLMVKPSASNKQ